MNQGDQCTFCKKGEIVFGKEWVTIKNQDILKESENPDDIACSFCFQYCEFCRINEAFDCCVCCSSSYCNTCADKWEIETTNLFMYGDHNICYKCYKKLLA